MSSLEATLAQQRWRKAVDNLWREVLYYRRNRLANLERERAEKRLKNLRRIVRHALSEYHRIQVERQAREEVERQAREGAARRSRETLDR